MLYGLLEPMLNKEYKPVIYNLLSIRVVGVKEVAARNIEETVKELLEAFEDDFLLFGTLCSGIAE